MNSSSLSSQKIYSCFLKLKQNCPDRTPLDPGKTLSEPNSVQGLSSMWALSSASGRGRWVWAVWTLTFEPRGHMSLEAIFEARNYTEQLGGLHLKQQWEYRTDTKVLLGGLKLNSTTMCSHLMGSISVWHGPNIPTHPPSALRRLLVSRGHISWWDSGRTAITAMECQKQNLKYTTRKTRFFWSVYLTCNICKYLRIWPIKACRTLTASTEVF